MSDRSIRQPVERTPQPVVRESSVRTHAEDRREAVLKALEIVASVSRGLYVPSSKHNNMKAPWIYL